MTTTPRYMRIAENAVRYLCRNDGIALSGVTFDADMVIFEMQCGEIWGVVAILRDELRGLGDDDIGDRVQKETAPVIDAMFAKLNAPPDAPNMDVGSPCLHCKDRVIDKAYLGVDFRCSAGDIHHWPDRCWIADGRRAITWPQLAQEPA